MSLTALLLAAMTPQDVYGLWLTQDRNARVEIADCGDGTPCGALVWIDPASGALEVDANNPDPELAERPLLGIELLSAFEPHGSAWRRGRIYDPETGRTYRSRIERTAEDELEVKGCLGPICRTQTWTRAAAE